MATLYSGVASVTNGPNCYHTVEYTATRSGTTITLNFTHKSWLQYAASWIGAGKRIDFYVKFSYGGKSYKKTVVVKESSEEWHGTAVRVRTLSIGVTGVGAVTTIPSVKTGTSRTDGTGKPGVHSRTNTVNVPAAAAPATPTMEISPSGTMLASTVVTITATNNGSGSGSFQNFKFYYKKNNGAWVLFATQTGRTKTFRPSDYGLTYGDEFYFKVTVTSSIGLSKDSATSGTRTVANLPTAPTGITAPSVVTNLTATQNISVSGATAVSGSIKHYQYWYSKNGGAYTLLKTAGSSTTFTWQQLGATLGDNIRFRVRTVNSFDLVSSGYKQSNVITSYEIEKARCYFKLDGIWKPSLGYVKVSGTWREGKGIYHKVDGQWELGL